MQSYLPSEEGQLRLMQRLGVKQQIDQTSLLNFDSTKQEVFLMLWKWYTFHTCNLELKFHEQYLLCPCVTHSDHFCSSPSSSLIMQVIILQVNWLCSTSCLCLTVWKTLNLGNRAELWESAWLTVFFLLEPCSSKIHEIVGKWGLSSDRVLLSNYRRKGKVEVIMEHSNE